MENNIKQGKKMKMFEKMTITKHFIERYCERILNITDRMEYQEVRDLVLEDMIERMTIIEKECFNLLSCAKNIKLTIGHTSQIIITNNKLITVY
tara:strand:- start:5530 stop:5811 length:282 start_codon:yes stop_codon:yes gene_type:complete